MILNIKLRPWSGVRSLGWLGWGAAGLFLLFGEGGLEMPSGYAGRPFATEDAGVAGRWVFQLEEGIQYADKNQDEEFSLTTTPILGLTDRLEVSADFPASFLRPEEGKNVEGWSDISLITKTQIFPEKEFIPAALLKIVVKFANGNEAKGLGSGDEDVQLVGVVSKMIKNLTVHGNAGYAFVGDDKDEALRDYLIYGVASEYKLSDRWKVAGELYGEKGGHFDADASNHHRLNPLVGLTFQVSPNVLLDLAWRAGLTNNEKPEQAVIAGLSISFDHFWKKKAKR
ncbi:MAG: transporter [Candidatus Omnitrophica bacterium]|nr:transporter [Candidatus Omnitrophota bacterium]